MGTSKRRLFVISDLHLGGEGRTMMSRPDLLAKFIEATSAKRQKDEVLELVIAGDVVDFLAIAPHESFTSDPTQASEKLHRVAGKGSPFKPVFDALAEWASVHELTVLVGNHDLELSMRRVQEAFRTLVGGASVRFVDDAAAYRVGEVLIEHGNAWDGANANDWAGVLELRAAHSRNLTAEREVVPSAGSEIVFNVVNPLKQRFTFVDLLQPEGQVLALLLLALEPRLFVDFGNIGRLLNAKRVQEAAIKTHRTREYREIAGESTSDAELEDAFGIAYGTLRATDHPVALPPWTHAFTQIWQESIETILNEKRVIPAKRVRQIRVALARMLEGDRSSDRREPSIQGEMATKMFDSGTKLVVMGHTHQARFVHTEGKGTYINTGTWADIIRVPQAALTDDAELVTFLEKLIADKARSQDHTFAEIVLSHDGRIESADLRNA